MNPCFRCTYWPKRHKDCRLPLSVSVSSLQGVLVHKRPPPRKTLQKPHAWGPMVIPGGYVLRVNEIPLYAMQVVAARMGEMQAEQERRGASHLRAKEARDAG